MKNLFLTLTLFVGLLSGTSCSDDDSSENTLIGRWQLESFIVDGVDDTGECERMNIIEFRTDGNVISLSHDSETTTSNDTNTQTVECISETSTIPFTVDGNTINTVDEEGDTNTENFRIENNKLIFGSEENGEVYTRI